MSARLFEVIDTVNDAIRRIEAQLDPIAREFDYSDFAAQKCGQHWRIVYRRDECKPIGECRIEVRLAFAKISRAFMDAYQKHAAAKIGELEASAEEALSAIAWVYGSSPDEALAPDTPSTAQ